MVTSKNQDDLNTIRLYLMRLYQKTRTTSSIIQDYLGSITANEVRVIMGKCIDDILAGFGLMITKVTLDASVLFDIRDAAMAT